MVYINLDIHLVIKGTYEFFCGILSVLMIKMLKHRKLTKTDLLESCLYDPTSDLYLFRDESNCNLMTYRIHKYCSQM